MRILMVNKYYPPHVGGIEFHVRDLAEGLVTAGHAVRVLVCNNERRLVEESINGVEIVRLPRLFERASTPVARHFGQVLVHEAANADIVHFHFPYPWGEFEWVGQLASKAVPYVITYHSDIVRQKTALAFYKPFLDRFLNRSRLIMASSPQLIRYSPWLAPRAAKCRQVDFGLPLDHIAGNAAAIRRGRQLRAEWSPDGAPIVLFVGRLIYYKGIEVLARAIPLVPNAHFVIVGRGPERARLDGLVSAHPELADRVHVIDWLDDGDLAGAYHAADLFTLPSVAPSEAFGLVQIEAQAAGIPVVSTRLRTGVPYANLDGVTGLTVMPGNADGLAGAINTLLSDEDLRRRLGDQAQERATTQFTIPRMVEHVTAVYAQASAATPQPDTPDTPDTGGA
ncbi:MAG: glycosyltransferase [Actinomycetes bacterium]|jgi:rhamnosyl/mannosyltransferase|nr:glycosyltransferase [Actinomycetes bacterium]